MHAQIERRPRTSTHPHLSFIATDREVHISWFIIDLRLSWKLKSKLNHGDKLILTSLDYCGTLDSKIIQKTHFYQRRTTKHKIHWLENYLEMNLNNIFRYFMFVYMSYKIYWKIHQKCKYCLILVRRESRWNVRPWKQIEPRPLHEKKNIKLQ